MLDLDVHMSLNKLPDGTDSPRFRVTAVSFSGEEKTLELQEWWFEGRRVETIEKSAEDAFYMAFDKESSHITEIVEI